ncbi:MAG: hypothetical protein GF334_06390 [Candidatus Altiarchaeales archaeon]|nr:hypothetical protein [Candidatus Altiarchaeales archaeon]
MSVLKSLRQYFRITKASTIFRRYFVLNGFDGLFTMLGIIVGSYVSGVHHPGVILGAGVSGIVALGFSGSASAYITEKSEQERSLMELEGKMLIDLDNTIHDRARSFSTLFTSFVNGFSPVATALLMAVPFLLASKEFFSIDTAFKISMLTGCLEIFAFGYVLGEKFSTAKKIQYGVGMLLVASLTALTSFVIGQLTG